VRINEELLERKVAKHLMGGLRGKKVPGSFNIN
jgi:hypothetical protein